MSPRPVASERSRRSLRRAVAGGVAGVLAVSMLGLTAPTAALAADVPAPTAH